MEGEAVVTVVLCLCMSALIILGLFLAAVWVRREWPDAFSQIELRRYRNFFAGCLSLSTLLALCCMCIIVVGVFAPEQVRTEVAAGEDTEPTATVLPTNTPEPTSEPTEVLTSEPTESPINIPESTNTPELPTPVPELTSMPVEILTQLPENEEEAQISGIGVSRDTIQRTFEELDLLKYQFEQVADVNEQPRVLGTPRGGFGRVAIELIGPSDDLTSAAAIVAISDDSPELLVGDILTMRVLLETVTPDWKEGSLWLIDHLEVGSVPQPGQWDIVHNNLQISLYTKIDLQLRGRFVVLVIKSVEN